MNNTNSLYIPVHSVSDLITNSSSTTYTMATDGTIKCVKEIVNSFLAVAGSTKTADDMFEFSLKYAFDISDGNIKKKAAKVGIEIPKKSWGQVVASDEQIAMLKNSLTEEELDEFDDPVDGDNYHNINLCVTPKNKTDPVTTKVAGLIEALIGTYNFESLRDG